MAITGDGLIMSNETTNRQHSTSVPLQEMTWTKYGQTHGVRWVDKMRGDVTLQQVIHAHKIKTINFF